LKLAQVCIVVVGAGDVVGAKQHRLKRNPQGDTGGYRAVVAERNLYRM